MSENISYKARPSVCRNCGAIVAAGESACPQCGLPLSAALNTEANVRRQGYDHEAMRFAAAVLQRPYTFTILFLIANLFVYLLMWSSSGLSGSALLEFPNSVLTAYGAKLNYLIRAGEWWRFVTPIFIHINLPHILVNMWSLWIIGPFVEKLYGSAKFVFFWMLTGVAGVLASYLTVQPTLRVDFIGRFLFKTMDSPSAGASGALFGLVGVLFVFGIKFRHELPEDFKRAFGTGLLPMILINLFIGYFGRGSVGNAAHLGGFFTGALAALFVGYKRPGAHTSVAVFWRVLQIALLALVLASFAMIALRMPREFPQDEERKAVTAQQQNENRIGAYLNAMNEGERVFIDAFNSGNVNAIETAVDNLKKAPALDETADALRNELIALLERVRQLASSQPQTKTEKLSALSEREKLSKDFQAWQDKHIAWAKENKTKYSLKIDEDGEKTDNAAPQNGSENTNRTTKD